MTFESLFSVFDDLRHTKLGGANCFSDRLSSTYTVYLLGLLAAIATMRDSFTERISCYCPNYFTDGQVEYTNKACWTSNTRVVPFDQELSRDMDTGSELRYYQWMPLIMVIQALLFYMPRPVWRLLNSKSGISVNSITDTAVQYNSKFSENDVEKAMHYMTNRLDQMLTKTVNQRKKIKTTNQWRVWKTWRRLVNGNYLVISYSIIKLLYLTNVIVQLVLLDFFLTTGKHRVHGATVIQEIISNGTWSASGRFPFITICNIKIRETGNLHRFSVQCVLPANLFYEVIFVFVWFWFAFIAVVTVCSLVYWISLSLAFRYHRRAVRSLLVATRKRMSPSSAESKNDVEYFIRKVLRRDGCFVLDLVSDNTSEFVTAELLRALWEIWANRDIKKTSIDIMPNRNNEDIQLRRI